MRSEEEIKEQIKLLCKSRDELPEFARIIRIQIDDLLWVLGDDYYVQYEVKQ